MNQINSILSQLKPFVAMVALLFGVLAAAKGLSELFPVVGQIIPIRGDAQRMAIIAAALALVAGRS